MKELIELSRKISECEVEGKAIVKAQKLGDSVITGASPVGIYYEGYAMSPILSEFIGENSVNFTLWQSNGKIKTFVTHEST